VSDTAGYPVTIDRGGSYRLTGDLVVPDENTDGIDVVVSPPAEVTIDLNGFSIRGPVTCSGYPPTSCSPAGGSGVGVRFTGGAGTRLRILNGTIRGMGSAGVSEPVGDDLTVESLRVRDTQSGIVAYDHARVVDTEVENALVQGIYVGVASLVRGCTVMYGGGDAVTVGPGSTVAGCTVSGNGGRGIVASSAATVTGNTVFGNKQPGISVVTGCSISDNTAYANQYGLYMKGVGDGYGRNVFYGNLTADVYSVLGNDVQTATNACGIGPC
jgi:parallel beta-helix repeat protein